MPRSNNISITFGPSRSPNIRKAKKLAQAFDDFRTGENNSVETSVGEIFTKWETFNLLFHTVRGWASFGLNINGSVIPKSGYSPFFYGLQDIYYCHNVTAESYQVGYCDQFDWGCSQIKSMRLHPAEYDGGHFWYNYGHFKGRRWIIHKNEIEAAIQDEIKRKRIDGCPLFDFNRIKQEIALLPDEIDLRENKYFEVVHRMKFVGGNIMEVPEGIRHRPCFVFRINKH